MHQHRGFEQMKAFWSDLNITSEQKQQMGEAMKSARSDMQQAEENARKTRAELMKLTASATADEAAIRKAAAAVGEALAESALVRHEARQAFVNVLTDEQKQKMEAAKSKFREKLEQRKQKMQEWKAQAGKRRGGSSARPEKNPPEKNRSEKKSKERGDRSPRKDGGSEQKEKSGKPAADATI